MAQPESENEPQYRPVRQEPLGGGIVDSKDSSRLEIGQTPHARNVEFDRDSVATTRGMRKFNNQVAPSGAFRTRADPGCPPLKFAEGMSVPGRGYGFLPYFAAHDIGGDFAEEIL